jgi:hypothetical protein
MRQGHSNNLSKEQESGNHSVGRQSSMKLMEYIFNPDQGMWCGYLKGNPDYQVSGESFEMLQVKLQQLHFDPHPSTPSLGCSSAALICWYWERRMSPCPYWGIKAMGNARHAERQVSIALRIHEIEEAH